MLGRQELPEMKTKGAETGVLLRWAVSLLQPGALGADAHEAEALKLSGEALLRYMELLKELPRVVPRGGCQACLDACLRHLDMFQRAGGHHLYIHLTLRMQRSGNPRYHSTFLDETLNAMLAKVAAGSHRGRWDRRIQERLRLQARSGTSHFWEY